MGIKEIIEQESKNENAIYLFKEGMFWRMYQKSAYNFTRQIKELKVMKKFYKNVNGEVVYAGFPDTILSQIVALCESKGLQFEKFNEKHCCISGFVHDNGFEQWFQSLVLFQKTDNQSEKSIIQRIKTYPVHHKTPLETVQFVAEIQKQLISHFNE